MNFGKYFRLNLKESKIVDGVAVYDYIDLPAFFGRSKDNSITPKYPFSLVITDESIRFHVHYCVFRTVVKSDNQIHFVYSPANLSSQHEECKEQRLEHMQEVILELPYLNGLCGSGSLYETLSQVYLTVFPQNDEYLQQLLWKRYRPDKAFNEQNKSIEAESYRTMQKNIDGDRSFSTLWLMDIQKSLNAIDTNRECHYVNITDVKSLDSDNTVSYVGFLRKLLLDFIFDLTHSDVFQSSENYQQMYSGLMSDFFFSSLLHKCDYYYYRGLTLDAIKSLERKQNNLSVKEIKNEKERIQALYATHLFKAEKQWIADVMNPSSDRLFDIPRDDFASDPQRIKNWDSFKIYDYWFAPPEEEMRRICFTTYSSNIEANNNSFFKRLKDRKLHLCNADTLAEYLSINNRDAIQSVRTRISQWFFKRYDFADALHLHAFRNFSLIEFVVILAVIIAVIAFPRFIEQAFWKDLFTNKVRIISVLLCALLVITSSFLAFTKGWGSKLFGSKHVLWPDHISLVWKRVFNYLVGVLGVVVIPIIAGSSSWNPTLKIIVAFISWAIFAVILIRGHWITNIHILYPRLLASITTAWLSLAIGNELFSAFFDSVPSVYSCVLLSLVVLLFLIYEINRQLPYVKRGEKFWRSVQMLVYSYGISLVVGLFIINFTGERFLERSEYLPTYYEEYSEVPNVSSSTNELGFTAESETVISYSHPVDKTNGAPKDSIIRTTTIGKAEIASQSQPTNRELLKGLRNKKIPNGNHPVVTVWDIGGYEFFILRDLLIQFAFLAMFIGVFIQMIFEEKSITEM